MANGYQQIYVYKQKGSNNYSIFNNMLRNSFTRTAGRAKNLISAKTERWI